MRLLRDPRARGSWWSDGASSPFAGQVRLGDGSQLTYGRIGRGSPLVLLGGLAGGWELAWPLARRLARTHDVIALGYRGDEPGIGPMRGRVEVASMARDLGEALDRLGLEAPTLVGLSFGGAVALEFAAECPERVGRLVIQGAEARFGRAGFARLARRVLERFDLPHDNPFVNQFFHLLFARKPEPGPRFDHLVRRLWATDRLEVAARLGALERWDVSGRLEAVTAPSLVLAGARDAIVPAGRQFALARHLPGGRFVALAGAGHVAFLTHPRTLAARIVAASDRAAVA